MIFNLNEFLIAVSFALDFVEMDLLGVVSNHSKRVAYMSLKMAEQLGLSKEEVFDTVSLAILHDNGASEKVLHERVKSKDKGSLLTIESTREHGILGERNIKNYPFLTSVENVIRYHHENYDGSGFFGIKGEDIPLISQIIKIADMVELNSNLKENCFDEKKKIIAFVKGHENTMFSPRIIAAFLKAANTPSFWMDLKDDFINSSLKKYVPSFSKDLPLPEIQNITRVFSRIVDSKSQYTQVHSSELSVKAARMAEYYRKPEDEVYKIMIAANLHDIGKLAVSNSILDKPDKLDDREFDLIKQHSYLTRVSLQEIKGFEEITEWASNHHEKLNGRGYPYGKQAGEIDFNSRLLACLDIYQALMEERPYREAMTHNVASEILRKLVSEGALDENIVSDILKVFAR
ncbi:MAG: HD domain-containing protein [Clostridia bacterium]|nr:HD domain-containing protein [Clostridia bacterium]